MGTRLCTAQVGRLWTSLADYYIRRGMYEKARDVYEEGLTTVVTVRDFSLIFDTLTQVILLPQVQRLIPGGNARAQVLFIQHHKPALAGAEQRGVMHWGQGFLYDASGVLVILCRCAQTLSRL